jgi:type IV pilus assembly protein PilQ
MSGLLTCFLIAFSRAGFAQTNAIESIGYSSLPGNAVQINIKLSEPAAKPLSFTINNPARIAFDFPNTVSKLSKRTQPIGSGIAESVTTITAKDKTRVILNLSELSPYKVNTQGNNVFVTLDNHISASPIQHQIAAANSTSSSVGSHRAIENIDFRRGEKGEGRVIIKLSDANIPMDVSEQNGKVIVRFIGADLPKELNQHLDVIDFATPVHSIESSMRDNSTRIEIKPIDPDFEHLAYQTDKTFTIELKPISREELEEIKKDKFGYVGERLSLNILEIQ